MYTTPSYGLAWYSDESGFWLFGIQIPHCNNLCFQITLKELTDESGTFEEFGEDATLISDDENDWI